MADSSFTFPTVRLRRLRQHPVVRDLVRQHALRTSDLVLPLFIKEGLGIRQPIVSMPPHCQLSLDQFDAELAEINQLGLKAVLLFGIPQRKDAQGACAWDENGIIQQAIRKIKSHSPSLLVIADLCFCEFTDHGHCGVLTAQGELDNDKTLVNLAQQALSLAQAGADVLAPSGMIDGMVGVIREALDQAGWVSLPILSYAVKYASSLYAPFRDAAEGSPQFGDRRSHQMDSADSADRALREVEQDLLEGADMIMVKPASYYSDVIYRIKQVYPGVPLCAYQVSGEYAMIQAAAQKGWLDAESVMMESLLSLKRAGADFIITYFAKEVAKLVLRDHHEG